MPEILRYCLTKTCYMKKIIKEKFGGTEIFFVAEDVNISSVTVVNPVKKSGLQVHETSAAGSVVEKLQSVREAIKQLITGLGSDIQSVQSSMGARTVEIELGISISVEGKLIVGAKAESSLNLTMKWEK